ncbi:MULTISPECIES: hypothetical protein [Amycolatopsis]|uniref:Cytochrome b/b6 C-terminal region profile domain-containing protein n=1 Tax=Amycolatopsis bullii TaxID=941987 RepID=A0ABQ3K3F7_9PSEU|nr:hypothetical protein [Amycolatopsis bullii]GHF97521.1 hypothetical protein GCM10017567_09910 [Amycolatopsis bullii]
MKPRWYFFAWFAVLAAAHLAVEGWTDTAAIGLPVGFAATLVLVFVPRLPRWATGEARPGSTAPRATEPPPEWPSEPLPKRPSGRRAVLLRKFAFATAALWAAVVVLFAAELAAVVVTGGWLPWVLPVPSLVVVVVLALWRYELAGPARCLASGRWTPVAAAAFDVRAGEPVDGWAVLPGDVRIRFHLPAAPADVAAELRDRRRLWLAGWPSEELVVGLPDGDSYAVGLIGARRGGGKNTVTRPPRPPVASSP